MVGQGANGELLLNQPRRDHAILALQSRASTTAESRLRSLAGYLWEFFTWARSSTVTKCGVVRAGGGSAVSLSRGSMGTKWRALLGRGLSVPAAVLRACAF